MNTLNGYSKSTLTNNNVLTASGGHIPLELLHTTPYRSSFELYDTLPMLLSGKLLGSNCLIVKAGENTAPHSKVYKVVGPCNFYSPEIMNFTPGETICIESWIMRPSGATGTAGTYYLGISFRDKLGKPINSNGGCIYLGESDNWTCPCDGVWHRRYNEYIIPRTHTAYNGSDGGGVFSGTVRCLINYSAGTIPTYYGGLRIYKKKININVNYAISAGSVAWENVTGKPTFAAVAISGSYNDLSNKPTIPTVGNGTVTIKQGGTTKGSFTMNQSGSTTIELTANTTYELATSNTLGLVKIGYEANAKNYPIELNDDGLMYVNVPWTSDNTWRTVQCNGTSIGDNTLNLKSGSNITLSNTSGDITITSTDTKNTAGSTNTSSKIFLIGATNLSTNPQTYSHDTAYVDTDGCLYSNSTKVSVVGHKHDYLPLSGGTMTGDVWWENGTGTTSRLPGHIYRNLHDTSGNVYDHYYPNSTSAVSKAHLRVKSNEGYKTLYFDGDGNFTWNGKNVMCFGSNGTENQVLISSGGNVTTWTDLSNLSVGNATYATSAGSASYATSAGSASYATSAGSATNANKVSGYSIVVQDSRPISVSIKQIIFVYE